MNVSFMAFKQSLVGELPMPKDPTRQENSCKMLPEDMTQADMAKIIKLFT